MRINNVCYVRTIRLACYFLYIILIFQPGVAAAGQAYLDKFLSYQQWSQHLPATPDDAFMTFISDSSPLANKLREKWLYQLAQKKDWVQYKQYYQPTSDMNLRCYQQIATYQLGQHQAAVQAAIPLWLSGNSQPKACNDLFDLLLAHHEIQDKFIEQRIALALENRNLSLARYLLQQFHPARQQDINTLIGIYQKPTKISQLKPGPLHGEFYLFGLKQLIPRNMKLAIKIWRNPRSTMMMNERQQQAFLVQLALYKAMRSEQDAPIWFDKIKPAFSTPNLIDWQIRYAIAHQHWQTVIDRVHRSKDQENPAWQYWLARAYEAQGQRTKAMKLYETIALKRNYYAFLASSRLKKPFHFENETINFNLQTLAVYKPVLDQIRNAYRSNQSWVASRLLNDFSSELPKSEQSALAYWVSKDLQWYGKSVYMCNNETLTHQLTLRFPLAYHELIRHLAEQYRISAPLIYAMIRQESTFFTGIVSQAGANGLMQLLPITAKVVAKRAKIPYSNPKELFIPEKNITLGVAYLQQLGRPFGWHPVLMVAAYNAGPRQVNYWLKNHAPKEIDIWIDTLPWQETRNYIKNVIAFYAVYQYRLHERPNLDVFMRPF